MTIKYPNIKVKLVGNDGDAFAILGHMRAAMRKAHVPAEEIKQFMNEAMAGDYNALLGTCMKWVDVS